MASVDLRNVEKRYGSVHALRGIRLTCASGDLTVLLGHSGAGKTSLLRLIAGLETADEGDIRIGGRAVNDLPPRARGVSMAFESYALYPQRTVFDNMAFSFRVAGGGKRGVDSEVRRRVREMADLLEIGHLLDRLPRQLSGGQRQRVALGRTLVRDAEVHLLDEPIAHLDAKLRHQLRGGLKHLQKERGFTTVWTTPDRLEAMSIADRIAVFRQGTLEDVGPPADLYERPKNLYIARSLGEPPMNILEARARRTGDAWTLEFADAALPVSHRAAEPLNGLNGDGRVAVGIRPGDTAVAPARPKGAALAAEVILHEPLGQYGVATLRYGDQEVKVKTGKGVHFRPGQPAWLVPDPERYYLFNPRTGESLQPRASAATDVSPSHLSGRE